MLYLLHMACVLHSSVHPILQCDFAALPLGRWSVFLVFLSPLVAEGLSDTVIKSTGHSIHLPCLGTSPSCILSWPCDLGPPLENEANNGTYFQRLVMGTRQDKEPKRAGTKYALNKWWLSHPPPPSSSILLPLSLSLPSSSSARLPLQFCSTSGLLEDFSRSTSF